MGERAWLSACGLQSLRYNGRAESSHALVALGGGYGTYAMGDVNDDIRAIDAVTAVKFDEINGGLSFAV